MRVRAWILYTREASGIMSYDERIMKDAENGNFEAFFDYSEDFCEKAAECGHRSFVIMAGAFDGVDVRAKALCHQDVTGVGYGICTFYPGGENEERKFLDKYLKKMEAEMTPEDPNIPTY